MKNFREEEIAVVIKYNWELLRKYSGDDPNKMLEFFDSVYIKKAENYFYLNEFAAKIVAESKGNAHNYIQNIPELVIAAKAATRSELLVYLDLASKRSYFNFVNTKGKMNYLPIWKIDNEYDIEALKMNRLLTFDDKNIYLLYEQESYK